MTETGNTVERLRAHLEARVNLENPTPECDDFACSLDEGRALLAVVEAAQEAVSALSDLAWVSYEGDPWFAEHENVDVDAVRDAEQRFKESLAALHTQASDEGEA